MIGKWIVETEYEHDVQEWLARLRFDTGCIMWRAKTRDEAINNLRLQWDAMGISGEFGN